MASVGPDCPFNPAINDWASIDLLAGSPRRELVREGPEHVQREGQMIMGQHWGPTCPGGPWWPTGDHDREQISPHPNYPQDSAVHLLTSFGAGRKSINSRQEVSSLRGSLHCITFHVRLIGYSNAYKHFEYQFMFPV